jgi:hypothetical protein
MPFRSSPPWRSPALAFVSLGGRPLPWTHPVIYGNWAYASDYLAVGAEIGEVVGDATVVAPPEIGATAYGCECSMVDMFSDPGRTLPLIAERLEQAHPVTRFLLRANFLHLDWSQQPREAEYRVIWTQGRCPGASPRGPPTAPAARGPCTSKRSLDRPGKPQPRFVVLR